MSDHTDAGETGPGQATPAHAEPAPVTTLFTYEFVVLSAISFFAFCNLSLFYGFNAWLERRGIPSAWRGVLLALEPATAFMVRPFLSSFLHLGNGCRVMGGGLVTIAVSLYGYSLADSLPALAVVRVAHGFGFVLTVSACMAILVHCIPRDLSGQGFGIFAITALVPYAVLPPVVERLLPLAGGESRVYALGAPLLLVPLLLLIPLGRRIRGRSPAPPPPGGTRNNLGAILEDLRLPRRSRRFPATWRR
jgi:hypothetical protein